ncbi:MAG TPA: undecaprenyl-diphosphatase [Methylophilaceae bacterium]|nr:undecaprenyl-diphosphatase [Methylophilaceae bacterium]HAJ71904.1 undecaprenyl-diphosphatase [Methylophilaceae bacterium]
MDIILLIKAFVLGIVEGATEFLPISSTGHLIIAGDLLNFNDDKGKVFEIVIQLAAILAVCWEYRRKLSETVLHLANQSKAQHFVLNLLIAFLPAAILGLAFHSKIKAFLFSPLTVAIALIIGGFAILAIEQLPLKVQTNSTDSMTPKQAFQIGLAQSLALIPGVSRAGATILGGMVFGLSRKTATEFSFFLAIPIMFAATILDVYKSWSMLSVNDIGMFTVGFVTAFISALIAIKFLLRYVASHDFKVFAWYRIILGLVVLWYFHGI